MKKSKTQETKLFSKKPSKLVEPPKSKVKLKAHIFRRLTLKHNSSNKIVPNRVIDSLVYNKTTHLAVAFKDDIIFDYGDEFLKRYYKYSESKERIPKIANYYKNYLTFFCNPIFRNFKVNSIIQAYSDNKAELYYNKTYSSKNKKDKKTGGSVLFNTKIKEDINNVVMALPKPDDSIEKYVAKNFSSKNKNLVEGDENNNSIFNDEFFIYRPEKKRYVDENLPEASSLMAFDYSRNCTMKSGGLLTLHSKEDEIFNIVSNMTKQPLNDKIIDKIQQKTTKKIVKSTYNFSTTDKSKGDSQNVISKNINISNHAQNVLIKPESGKNTEQLKRDQESRDSYNYLAFSNNNFNYNSSVNHQSPSIQYTIKGANIRQDSLEKGMKKSLELVDMVKPQIPNSSKNKLVISSNYESDLSSKSPLPTTVKQQKYTLAIGSLKNAITNSKVIDYNKIKSNKPNNSNAKFANLLYSSENNFKSLGYSHSRTGSNPQIKIPIQSIKKIEINKYNADIKSPNCQTNNLQDIKYYEYNNKVQYDSEDRENLINGNFKPTLSVHLDKVFKAAKQSPANQGLLQSHGFQGYASNDLYGSSKGERVKSNDKLFYNNQNKEEELDQAKPKNLRSEKSTTSLQNNIQYNDINHLYDNNIKIKNYLNNSKKITCATGYSEDSNRVLSSIANTKTTMNNAEKNRIPEKTPTSNRNIQEGKIKLANYYQVENKGLSSTRGISKGAIASYNSEMKLDKKTPMNRRMKSGDFYSNNYVSNNLQHNNNMNAFLQKISSTKSIQSNVDGKQKKIQFSPQGYSKKN